MSMAGGWWPTASSRPLTVFGPWAEATCTYIDTQGIRTLWAEPNRFLLHLLSHSDTVSSARLLHWLVKHSRSTPRAFFLGPSAKETRRLVTSEVQPCGGYGHWWSFCIPWLSLLRSWRNGSASGLQIRRLGVRVSLASFVALVLSLYAHIYTLSYSGLRPHQLMFWYVFWRLGCLFFCH